MTKDIMKVLKERDILERDVLTEETNKKLVAMLKKLSNLCWVDRSENVFSSRIHQMEDRAKIDDMDGVWENLEIMQKGMVPFMKQLDMITTRVKDAMKKKKKGVAGKAHPVMVQILQLVKREIGSRKWDRDRKSFTMMKVPALRKALQGQFRPKDVSTALKELKKIGLVVGNDILPQHLPSDQKVLQNMTPEREAATIEFQKWLSKYLKKIGSIGDWDNFGRDVEMKAKEIEKKHGAKPSRGSRGSY